MIPSLCQETEEQILFVDEFNYLDLCRKVGALHLIPENADYYTELVRCSVVVAALSTSNEGPFRISDLDFDAWINSGEAMTGPEMSGDSLEGIYASQIPFFGGGKLLLTPEPNDAFQLECLLEAACRRLDKCRFQKKVVCVATLGLAISNECIRRAAISRKTEPPESQSDEIAWHRGSKARSLESSVDFSFGEIEHLVTPNGVGIDGLDRLSFTRGDISCDYECILANPIRHRPILRYEGGIIVVSPLTLGVAIRNAILEIAAETGVLKDLMTMYQDAVCSRVDRNARRLSWEVRDGGRLINGDVVVDDRVFSADTDKVVVTYLVTDHLIHGDLSLEKNFWDCKACLEVLEKRIKLHHSQLTKVFGDRIDIVHCLITEGIGRPHIFGGPDLKLENGFTICLTADEFQVFALLNRNDPLALWRVAVGKKKMKGGAIGSFLDHYALFRDRNESYYFGDDGIPDFYWFAGSGLRPRLDLVHTVDPHFVQLPDRRTTQVFRAENKPDFDIYLQEPEQDSRMGHLVEGYPFPIWVVASDSCDLSLADIKTACFHLNSMIAFWLWQLRPNVLPLLPENSEFNPLTIVVNGTKFSVSKGVSSSPASSGFEVGELAHGVLTISFEKDFAAHCSGATNQAELTVAAIVIEKLFEHVGVEIAEAETKAIIDFHAGDPYKRRLKVTQDELVGILNTSGLPSASKVMPFDEQAIQDRLASELELSGAIREGTLPDAERISILNKTVGLMYGDLQALIALHSNDELVLELVARHEALIADRKLVESITNSHLASLGRTEHNIRDVQRDLAEIDKASVANRFLIEYVAAQPPSGDRQFSMSNYLRMLALASTIFFTGQTSDSIRYQLSNHSINLLKSKRIRIRDEEYENVFVNFHNRMFDRIVKSGLSKSRQEPLPPTSNSDSEIKRFKLELETATLAEFGFSISKIADCLGAIAGSQFTTAVGVGRCKRQELIASVSSEILLPKKDVSQLVGLLSLEKRADFLKPNLPHRPADVYPWVFNRSLSYLRRPLIAHDKHFTWGTRAIRQAADYLFDICTSGRLKNPTSKAMRSYIGTVVNHLGQSFNNKIIEQLNTSGDFLVRGKMRKFNGKKLARDNGESLGDIDILAIRTNHSVIFPIEAKCFSMGKTSAEIAIERDDLFGDLAHSTGKIGRHLERVKWLNANLEDVAKELGLRMDGNWRIEPLIVLDVDLLSSHLVDSPILITTREALVETLKRFP